MTWTGWLITFFTIQIIHFSGTWKLYVAAGKKAWEAIIPIYNAVVLMNIINRPRWWVVLLFIPVVNLIMFPVIWIETVRSFGYNKQKDTLLTLLSLGFYIYYINYTQKLNYIEDRDLKPKSPSGEWVSSILFAIVAATLVHTYFMQPFTIPTSSLEKTLLVGDYLFVSKFHYGARSPMTSISLPMLHDTVPLLKTKSYHKKLQYPYARIPGVQKIKNNDIVVFNWPVDTLVDILKPYGKVDIKPIDKKTNYVKRCVGIPGDSLEIKDGYVYINGKKNELPDRAKIQFAYTIVSKESLVKVDKNRRPTTIPTAFVADRYDISDIHITQIDNQKGLITHTGQLTDIAYEKLKSNPSIVSIKKINEPSGVWDKNIFPNHKEYAWTSDHFGPIYIPKAGTTVAITPKSIPFYKRIIEVYEGSELGITNKVSQTDTEVFLNNEPITQYTFKQDYYWMMGDNRDYSQDARMWGYVPFNHILGKPVFIWMSLDKNKGWFNGKIRWNRVFTTVGGSGKPVSYFKYFIVALLLWYGFNYFRKRKKKDKLETT